MYIKKIKASNFRNIEKLELSLSSDANIIYGNNAQGKTNLIEAIYLFAFGKPFRTNRDIELLKFDKEYFYLEMDYFKAGRYNTLVISYDKANNKKVIKVNGVVKKKLSDIIGKINLVIFKPEDAEIVKEGPSIRRKYLNFLISSLEHKYIHYISSYNKLLEERNNLLKKISKSKYFNNKEEYDSLVSLLYVYNEELVELNFNINKLRNDYINKINSEIQDIHRKISNTENVEELLKLKYVSSLNDKEEISKNFEKTFESDIEKGYTSIGIHKDDFKITINGLDVSKYGSQGQQKSSVLSLKLAELEIIKKEIGETPILLLDDFMSELDNSRVKNIIDNIEQIQMIVTTTEKTRIENKENEFYYVKKGVIIKENETEDETEENLEEMSYNILEE